MDLGLDEVIKRFVLASSSNRCGSFGLCDI